MQYRNYKNGIYGHRYKKYYIIKGEKKGLFQIWDENKNVLEKDLYDYNDCEWYIDKMVAEPEVLQMLKDLYELRIFDLTGFMLHLIKKREVDGFLSQEEEEYYKWIVKVRSRKDKGRPF